MTMVVNEIHLLHGLARTMMVAAADRRLTQTDGRYYGTQRKLFPIPYLNGSISYFGLAAAEIGGRLFRFSSWLPTFIRRQSGMTDLQAFCTNLRGALHQVLPPSLLTGTPSGFQVCGYGSLGLPEFWAMSNIGGMEGIEYRDIQPRYGPPMPDFLGRDAVTLGWDGSDPLSAHCPVPWTYRNGDYRLHIAVWDVVDDALGRLLALPHATDFRVPNDPRSYGEYVRFKMEFIAYFYKNWARSPTIGRPIDVIVMTGEYGRGATLYLDMCHGATSLRSQMAPRTTRH